MKTADEILAAKKCGDIFTRGSKESVVLEYRALARVYHPDVCKLANATEITKKLNDLYEEALHLIELGAWEISNTLEIHDLAGRRYTTKYLKSFPFELGTAYVSDFSVTYLLDTKHEAYFDNAVKMIGFLQYESPKMEQEISRYMPKIRYSFKTADGRYCIILEKTPDVFLLEDVLRFYNSAVPDRHVAWIISRLCNVCCYFDYLGIAHNGLTVQNCFISPQYHTILPLGGWWYARKIGEKMLGVPKQVYDIMPVKAKGDKISSIRTDLESAKLIGRQLLDRKTSPKEIAVFLDSGSSAKAVDEFKKWNTVLDSAYGERRFVEMKIDKTDIYQNL